MDTPSKPPKDPGFIKLRRGFREHLPGLSGNAVKLYVCLLLSAGWKEADRGIAVMDQGLSTQLKLPKSILRRAVRELLADGYVAITRRGNQHRPTVVQILKFDSEAQSTNASSRSRGPRAQSSAERTNAPSNASSTFVSPSEISKLETPKNLKNIESRSNAEQQPHSPPKETVWGCLGIEPCGTPAFRTFLEGYWSSRNGDLPSEVIGKALDSWEDTEGAKPPRCAPLFKALSDLRKKESAPRIPTHRIPTLKEMIPSRGEN